MGVSVPVSTPVVHRGGASPPCVLSESLLVAAILAPLIQMRNMGMCGEDGVAAGEGAGGWVMVAVLVGLVLCTKGLPQRGIVYL